MGRLTPDVCILGAGLSGLTDAILMAESGRSVVVLEQHAIAGGYLQRFRRKGTWFDVGFHWVGSTRRDRPLCRLLEYLQVRDRIEFEPYPESAAIEIRSGKRAFAYPTRYDAFLERARAQWPNEREGLDRLADAVDETCARFRWFDLRRDGPHDDSLFAKSDPDSLADRLDGWIEDPWLRTVLALPSFNIGLDQFEIPWSKHALAFRANFDDTSRIRGGGGALVDALVARGRELGVEYRFKEGAAAIDCEGRRVVSIRTERGNRVEPGMVLAACHPKVIFRMIADEVLGRPYKDRILRMRDSRGAIQLFARLREPLRSLDRTGVLLDGDPPMLVLHPDDERLEVMVYADQEPFSAWRDRPVMRRGAEYEALKSSLADGLLERIAAIAPELSAAISDLYTATPLSDEWYTRNEHGAVFGISHDIGQQGMDRPMPRMRLKNLWYTGHSITMPGILGVMINSFATCEGLRGDHSLFDSVAR